MCWWHHNLSYNKCNWLTSNLTTAGEKARSLPPPDLHLSAKADSMRRWSVLLFSVCKTTSIVQIWVEINTYRKAHFQYTSSAVIKYRSNAAEQLVFHLLDDLYNMLCVSEGIWDANVCLRKTCLTIAWCTAFLFQSHRSWAPKNMSHFVPSCKIHMQRQQWHIPKPKGNTSKHDRGRQKELMGLRYYLRLQDGSRWCQGACAGS